VNKKTGERIPERYIAKDEQKGEFLKINNSGSLKLVKIL
jgi:hypothetical protein